MNKITQVTPATADQLEQINRIIADPVVEKVMTKLGLDKDGAQRVIEHNDELVGNIGEVALATLKDLSVSDKYKDEEEKSNYGYLSGYTPMRGASFEFVLTDLERQAVLLDQYLGIGTKFDIDFARKIWVALPQNAEKLFISFGKNVLAGDYNAETQLVLDKIKQTRNGAFYNYHEGQLGPHQLRQMQNTIKMELALAEMQKPGLKLIVEPGQFGIAYAGCSVRRSHVKIAACEFTAGSKKVGTWLLTHPLRLAHYDDLWIACAGDEFAPGVGGGFSRSPVFGFDGDRLKFFTDGVSNAYEYYGSVSGFIPQ